MLSQDELKALRTAAHNSNNRNEMRYLFAKSQNLLYQGKIDFSDLSDQKVAEIEREIALTYTTEPFERITKTFYRFGDFRGVNSYNFREQKFEEGVSCINREWLDGYGIFWNHEKQVYKFEGFQITWGSDGEPVVFPLTAGEKVSYEEMIANI